MPNDLDCNQKRTGKAGPPICRDGLAICRHFRRGFFSVQLEALSSPRGWKYTSSISGGDFWPGCESAHGSRNPVYLARAVSSHTFHAFALGRRFRELAVLIAGSNRMQADCSAAHFAAGTEFRSPSATWIRLPFSNPSPAKPHQIFLSLSHLNSIFYENSNKSDQVKFSKFNNATPAGQKTQPCISRPTAPW